MTPPFTPTWDADAMVWVLFDADGRVCGRFARLIDAEDAATGGEP